MTQDMHTSHYAPPSPLKVQLQCLFHSPYYVASSWSSPLLKSPSSNISANTFSKFLPSFPVPLLKLDLVEDVLPLPLRCVRKYDESSSCRSISDTVRRYVLVDAPRGPCASICRPVFDAKLFGKSPPQHTALPCGKSSMVCLRGPPFFFFVFLFSDFTEELSFVVLLFSRIKGSSKSNSRNESRSRLSVEPPPSPSWSFPESPSLSPPFSSSSPSSSNT
mmetsp:Transcript_7042/g.15554  ORF Transcript_7042/g.15554 Transcript_7042/m.15554 type:complete len:219 (-) Transcript_7042:946-1602(-)